MADPTAHTARDVLLCYVVPIAVGVAYLLGGLTT